MEYQKTVESMTIKTGAGSVETAISVLETCIKLRGTTDFRATMQDVINDIRDLCDAEHCCILIMNEYERSCYVLGEALSKDTRLVSMNAYINDDFYDIAESWKATIAGSDCLIAKDAQGMETVKEKNPIWYESLTMAGAHNIVLFPLKSRNELLGYMWVINFDKERAARIKETLEVTTFILGSELGNHLLLKRLRKLSSRDSLTGVMNRNEMNNLVDSLCHTGEKEKESVGVIFADLNGLKGINDYEGHNAGDVMLKNAAKALKEVFPEENIFRAGGDEFAVIVTGIDRKKLEEKIGEIRRACEKYENVVFALGSCVEEDSRNVRMALRRADERMYEDKRRLNEEDPEKLKEDILTHSGEDAVEGRFRERSIIREMNYDYMTGLPSMTYFFKLAENGRRNMYENGIGSAILFLNLGGMKYFNKRYGFAEGDILIKGLAEVLGKTFGETNCSRFGQDHFAVYTEAEDLEKKLKIVFRGVARLNNGNSLPVRAGIYLDSMGFVEASQACDRAKYASKVKREATGSYFSYYDKKMLDRELNRQYIIDHLEMAINENWIKAFYQPIVRATHRRICDEEALARWIDPKKGMLSPGEFIPILEEARLIYKVDLHIVDIILERIRKQQAAGTPVVPISVNLSRTDFECCDIVEEIDNRFRTAGVSRDLVTIEITESVVGESFDFMKEQIGRFQKLGFKVWMDDFGSGYSSLDLLTEMQFDLIKFDMRFMRQFDSNPRSRILLKELMRMAQSLGIETICEGVETEEQAEFLSEIGCTRLQGYYFCKPVPAEEIAKREQAGSWLGYENPDEAGYYGTVAAVNMYDLASLSKEGDRTKQVFDSMPMSVIEYGAGEIRVVRSNSAYKEFFKRYFAEIRTGEETETWEVKKGFGDEFYGVLNSCRSEGECAFLDAGMGDGLVVHTMVKRIVDNPVRDVAAYMVAVLDIVEEKEQKISYADLAQALSSDYISLYYVDLETDRFVEYTANERGTGISLERHGEHFFDECRKDIDTLIYEEDREDFVQIFTREKVLHALQEHGTFVHAYRLLIEGVPTYVTMKVVQMLRDPNHIIIGVNNIDAQRRQQETIERLREEQTTYSRISALMGDFIAIYTVDPDSGKYMQYSASRDYSRLQTSKAGEDFFRDSIKESKKVICPEDMEYFLSVFSKEKVLEKTQNRGIYKIRYRLMINGMPVKISLRAGMVMEKGGPQLIVGVGRSTDD